MDLFSLSLEELKKIMEKENNFIRYKCIMLSLPSGLSRYSTAIKDFLEKYYKGEIYIYADESFGGCDLPIDASKRMKCNIILHFGHAPFLNQNIIEGIRVFYIPIFIDYDISPIIQDIFPYIKKYKEISLHSPLQYTKKLKYIKEELEKRGIKTYLSKSAMNPYPGQILGCNISSFFVSLEKSERKKIDAVLYIGEGLFHTHALLKYLPKNVEVITYNPHTKQIKIYTPSMREKIIKRYYALYSLVKSSKKIGFLISTKIGQYTLYASSFQKIAHEFRKEGKEIYVFIGDKLTPSQINDFTQNVDALLNFACPRLEDDYKSYSKPIISYTTYKLIDKELKEHNTNS